MQYSLLTIMNGRRSLASARRLGDSTGQREYCAGDTARSYLTNAVDGVTDMSRQR